MAISPLSAVASAQTPTVSNNLSSQEISQIQKLASDASAGSKKDSIAKILKTNPSANFKKFITEDLAIDKKTEYTVNTTFKSKYDSSIKNYTCWDGTSVVGAYSYSNALLYRFNLRVNACADYAKVYSGFVRSTWGEIYQLGWSYYGETGDRKFSYINNSSTEFISSRQGLFKLCISNNWSCVQEDRPWIERHSTRLGSNDYQYQG